VKGKTKSGLAFFLGTQSRERGFLVPYSGGDSFKSMCTFESGCPESAFSMVAPIIPVADLGFEGAWITHDSAVNNNIVTAPDAKTLKTIGLTTGCRVLSLLSEMSCGQCKFAIV